MARRRCQIGTCEGQAIKNSDENDKACDELLYRLLSALADMMVLAIL